MKIRKIYIAIGLVGVITTSFPSATSALSSYPLPATKEKNELMSQEEMAHKMMLFKEAHPELPSDIAHGHIGPTLHAVNVTTFTCPTVEELQPIVLKNSLIHEFKNFEINGIHFKAVLIPPAHAKFKLLRIEYKGPEKEITHIKCAYEEPGYYYQLFVKLDEYPFKGSRVTFSQNDMKFGKIRSDSEEDSGEILFNKNIEFIVQP